MSTSSNATSAPAASGVVEQYDIYDASQYPWMSFNFFLLFWLAALLFYFLHTRVPILSCKFRHLDEAKRRNVIIYIMQGLATTVALGFQIYGGMDLLFRQDTTSDDRIDSCLMAWIIVCTLYIWELLYRIDIGLPLLLHHIVTIILHQVGWCSFFATARLPFFRYGLLLTFHATTEQFTFVALYCYRMGLFPQWHKAFFQMAAVQAVLIKTLLTVALVVYFALGIQRGVFEGDWGLFWQIAFPPLLLTLYLVQMYSAYILVVIGRRCDDKNHSMKPDPLLCDDMEDCKRSETAEVDLESPLEQEHDDDTKDPSMMDSSASAREQGSNDMHA